MNTEPKDVYLPWRIMPGEQNGHWIMSKPGKNIRCSTPEQAQYILTAISQKDELIDALKNLIGRPPYEESSFSKAMDRANELLAKLEAGQ